MCHPSETFETPFSGEMMQCLDCGRLERSCPELNSQWRALEYGKRLFYFCPAHFPRDGALVSEFEATYRRLLIMAADESLIQYLLEKYQPKLLEGFRCCKLEAPELNHTVALQKFIETFREIWVFGTEESHDLHVIRVTPEFVERVVRALRAEFGEEEYASA